VLVVLIYRWRTDTDEDSWWKGKGKALGRWFSRRTAFGLRPAPAAAMQGSPRPGKWPRSIGQSLKSPARSSAVSAPPESASPSITSANSWDFLAFSAITFSSMVSLATSR
jgi:hypothetical protein